ncbi:MAG: hypothetical protein IJS93_00285 [Clostridia bacterium]|nr:hypothetical protein [Clostridia bacterium]
MKHKRKKIIILSLLILFSLFSVAAGIKIRKNVREIYREYSYAAVKSRIYRSINVTTDKIVVQNSDSAPLVKVEKDENGLVTHITPAVNEVNVLSNLVAVECQKDLLNERSVALEIPYGAFSGSPLLADKGRTVTVPIKVEYAVKSDFRPIIQSVGINVIRYALYLEVTTEAKIAIPENEEIAEFKTYVLVSENVFSTNIPDTYISSKEDLQYIDLLP